MQFFPRSSHASKIYSSYRSKFERDAKSSKVTISGISFPEVSPTIGVLPYNEPVIHVIGHNRLLPDKYITLVHLAIKITFLCSLSAVA